MRMAGSVSLRTPSQDQSLCMNVVTDINVHVAMEVCNHCVYGAARTLRSTVACVTIAGSTVHRDENNDVDYWKRYKWGRHYSLFHGRDNSMLLRRVSKLTS